MGGDLLDRGQDRLYRGVLSANTRMLALVKSLGFRIETDRNDPTVKLVSKVL